MSRKCEYGVLEITSDTNVLLSHESQTSDLTKDFCFTRDFQNPILTFLALLKTTNKRYKITNEMRYLSEKQKNLWNWCLTKVNVLTCDYIDFYKLAISQDRKTCETDAGQKSMYSHVTTLTFVWHMWLHWLSYIRYIKIMPSPSIYMANCPTVSLL